MKTSWSVAAAAVILAACASEEAPESTTGGVFVQLFEWRWEDIANECESVLGPAGYAAVQISPPQEHIQGPAWWTRYQPVSYKIESRGGTRAELADMVQRCADVGVDIYADAITNHMAGFDSGTGVAGSAFSEYDYPVPYGYDDFHHCGRGDDDRIANYQDLWEVQNCQLGTLDDLDTGKPSVQEKIAAYLNDLLSLGVAGLRMDAVKHVAHDEVHAVLQLVDGRPIIYQEVIDRGGEPISSMDYLKNGMVTEFKYSSIIVDAFELGNLDALTDFASQPGWLPPDQAIVFVDNHDNQRGHGSSGEVVNYKDGASYNLAVAFMLAHPYGYPMVMSSYEFEDDGQGPPDSSPLDDTSGCGKDWVCEHRRNTIANMVAYREATAGSDLVNWQIIDDTVLSFGRGDKGHVVINTGEQAISLNIQTNMPAGAYCNVIAGCADGSVAVDNNGKMSITIDAQRAVAIHSGTSIETIELSVTVPADTPTLYLTGNIDFLGPWDPNALAMQGEGRERSATIRMPTGYDLEYKFTLGSWHQEASDPNGLAPPNHRLTVSGDHKVSHEIVAFKEDPTVYIADWENSGVLGTLVYWQDVESAFLTEKRHVEIWLPPGYGDEPDLRYRVIYMHDGQNLFDPRIANTGVDWGVDEAMMRGVESGNFDPAIVVGAWSSSERTAEYSPWHHAPNYARFLIEELMPRVNAQFRTMTGPENTSTMGSSMGGLLSYYLVKNHPDVFGACGCVSAHFLFAEALVDESADTTPYIIRDIANDDTVPKGVRFSFDFGTTTLDATYEQDHQPVREWLLEQGLVEGQDFQMRKYEGAAHSEYSWRARVEDQLEWLLGRT